jgi:NitT/TauT family transport system permease protein
MIDSLAANGVVRLPLATRMIAYLKASRGILPYVVSFGVLFLIWHFVATFLVKSILFPSPAAVVTELIKMIEDGSLIENIWASLKRILAGFFIGSVVAIPIGLTMGSFGLARKFIEPWTEFLRFIPGTAMITTAVIWFGIGEVSKIFLIAYATIFIVILNTAAGVSSISVSKIRAARALGASSGQLFFLVTLPATVPFILTGMRLAMANSFLTIVAAEMVAANDGIGVMIWDGRMFMLINQIFAALITLGVLGFSADRLFRIGIYRYARKYSAVT